MKCPSAAIYPPGHPSILVKVIRSSFTAWCTPADLRFSSTIQVKSLRGAFARFRLASAESGSSISSASSAGITRCCDRLSTVKEPDMRTFDVSSYGRSYRSSTCAFERSTYRFPSGGQCEFATILHAVSWLSQTSRHRPHTGFPNLPKIHRLQRSDALEEVRAFADSFPQITSISVLLAIDFRVTCGARS